MDQSSASNAGLIDSVSHIGAQRRLTFGNPTPLSLHFTLYLIFPPHLLVCQILCKGFRFDRQL